MSQDEVLRMVATARDNASGPLRKVEDALRGLGKSGGEQARLFRENFGAVHEQMKKVGEVAKTGVAPAIDAIGVSSLSAVGAVAALVGGLKSFVDQGTDVAAFGRKVQLTTNTIRGLEGVADKFHVDPGALRAGEQAFSDIMYKLRRHHDDLGLFSRRRSFAEELAATPETIEGNEKALKIYLDTLEKIKKEHGEPTARAFSKEMTGTDAWVDMIRDGVGALEEARKRYRQFAGDLDGKSGEKWVSNWSDFKASIEGVRNAVGNALLPDLTELAVQAREFFSENKVEISREIVASVREIGAALHGINTGVQAIGGWKTVFEGLAALKLAELALNIWKVVRALGGMAALGTPPAWVMAMLAIPAAGAAATTGAVGGLNPAARKELYQDPTLATMNPDLAMGAAIMDAQERRQHPGQRRMLEYLAGHRTSQPAPTASHAANAAAIIQGLRNRGLDATHAAIMAGNIQRESDFDPTKPNVAEGGIGLLQWRLDRRVALQALAAKRHKLETDAGVQLDFLMNELYRTPAGKAFLAAQSPLGMNMALHRHIGYGDKSEAVRFAYGRALLPLAELSQPGSLLLDAMRNGMDGGGKTTGSASIDVNFRNTPPGTSVRADAKGMFDRVKVDRGLSLGPPLADGD
jgi:Phage tail lysozyme